MMNSILFNQLTIFHAIADAGSITAAAKRLGMATPSVSKSLKLLEKDIGTPLFYRTTRHISLTPEGQKLKDSTKDALFLLTEAVNDCKNGGQTLSGTVKITLSRFAYYLILKDIIGKFYDRSPHIHLEISVNDAAVDIAEQGFDLGVRFTDTLAMGVIAKKILPPFKLGLFASQSYAQKHGLPQTPDEMTRHAFIGYRFGGSGRLSPLVLEQGGTHQTLSPRTVLVANDIDVVANAVKDGIGIGRLFVPVLNSRADRDDFVPVLPDYWQTYPPVSIYYHQHSKNRQVVKAVVDFITAAFDAV